MIRFSFLMLAGAMIFYACTNVAVTGRRQLALVSNAELIPMAAQQYDQVLREGKVVTEGPEAEMIKRVGTNIQRAVEQYMAEKNQSAELAGFSWQFNLLDDPTVNAWCMPGGKVAFYTGILPLCRDELGVAVVMGHEIAHALANHGRERMSQQMAAQVGLGTIAALMGQNPTLGNQLLMQAIGAGAGVGMLRFSREHESEADYLGLIFMAKAGYDPAAAPAFWDRMSALSGGQQPPEFLSTHPSHDTRIKDLNKWIPEAMQHYRKD
jgi:predicted Zn-dependent protease